MPSPLPNRDRIVASLVSAKKALHAGRIATLCGVEEESYRSFLELLEQLVIEGTLASDTGARFRVPRRRKAQSWGGSLSVHARGFGFVSASGKTDVFIAEEMLGGALHGDTVNIVVTGENSRGTEGRVESIVERRNPRVAGLVRKKRRSAWLEPDDARVRGPIVLHDGFENCEDGEAGVARITRFPVSVDENPEGRLVAVLGKPGEANVEVAKIMVREQIEEDHPQAAMLEAEELAAKAIKLSAEHRTDLRHIPFLTIDPVDARDHDDAVWAERTDRGFRIYIGIADVSEYVTPGSALDAEAKERGCTIYLPDRAIPMLPGLLAADKCSLLPDQDRYCMCVIAELDSDGIILSYRVVEGIMRAAAMVSYGSAARTLGFTDAYPLSPQAEAFKKPLKVLASVSAKLRRARMKRGALNLDLPEPQIELDESGKPVDVKARAQDAGVKKAYAIVEDMMLLANELVARWMGKQKAPAIYRVHGVPDPEKLERFARLSLAIGVRCNVEDMQDPLMVSKWLKRVQKHPQKRVLEGLLLRSLQQAVYDIVNVGHFGLASDAYLHFTSPIRRYPDLLVHRQIKHLLRGGKPNNSTEATEELRNSATRSSTRERAAMSVEREVVDLYRTLFMRDHIGDLVEGRVTALVGAGVFVAIQAPFVEVMVKLEDLGRERYELADNELSYIGKRSGERVALGDIIVMEVTDVSILRRTVYARRMTSGSEYDSEQQREQEGDGLTAQRRGRRPRAGRAPSRASRGERGPSRRKREDDETRGASRSGSRGRKSVKKSGARRASKKR